MKRFLFTLSLLFFLAQGLYAYQTTVRIAVIRVAFQKDANELTTGDGTFMIDTLTTTPFAIDPAPHNRTYFNDQLLAASNYFSAVSAGKLRLKATVFPKTQNGNYTLAHPMAFYNPNTSQDDIDTGVARLFADALLAADRDTDIDFNNYDLVLIFHAGVGRDINLGIDETPQDIPSLYITPQFLSDHLPEYTTGVPVDDGKVKIQKGIVLPETENQAGFQLALTGFVVSNIGSYLGLYDLFSAREQTSGIGRFGLMDVGLLNASGLIPSPPSAFSRQLLGWGGVQQAEGDGHFEIRRQFETGPGADIIEIPVSEDESYLLEYRGIASQNLDSLQFVLSEGRDELAGYMETLQNYFSDQIEISDSSGVLLKVANYDLGLPGAGILLWHIDHSVIRQAYGAGINNDPEHRAVDLEEADGSQDIGQQYTLLDAGFQSELGTPLDFWYKGNPAPIYKNEFSLSSIPAARSYNNHADLGIALTNFSSNNSSYMSFDLKRSGLLSGYPYKVNSAPPLAMVLGQVEKANLSVLFSVDSLGVLSMFVPPAENAGAMPLKLSLAQIMPAKNTSIALGDVLDDGSLNSLWAVAADSLYAFDLRNLSSTGLVDTLFAPLKLLKPAISAISVYNGQGYVSDGLNIYRVEKNGKVHIIPSEARMENLVPGLTDVELPSTPVTYTAWAQKQPGKAFEVRFDKAVKTFTVLNDGQPYSVFNVDEVPVAPFALADIDLNGVVDVVYNAAGKLWAFNANGTLLSGFPFEPVLGANEHFVGTPVVVQGDDLVAEFSTTNFGQLFSVASNGRPNTGFPRLSGGQVSHGPLFFKDQSGIGLLADSGNLYMWNAGFSASVAVNSLWNGAYGGPTNTARQYQIADIPVVSGDLIPQKKFYNYPNPNTGNTTTLRYFLSKPASVTLRVFDPTGYKVWQTAGSGFGNTTNEVVWDVSNVASGVYICQIEARAGALTERKTIKIMVVH